MDKVDKLIEETAHKLSDLYYRKCAFDARCRSKREFDETVGDFMKNQAKQILSHPDLFVQEDDDFRCMECGEYSYIRISEILEEK